MKEQTLLAFISFPVIIMCENNKYAISVPVEKQVSV